MVRDGFSRLQTIQTYGAQDVTSFKMNGQIFLAIPNSAHGSKKKKFASLRGISLSPSSHFLLL